MIMYKYKYDNIQIQIQPPAACWMAIHHYAAANRELQNTNENFVKKNIRYKIPKYVTATQYKLQTSMTKSVLLRPVQLKCDRSLASMLKCVVFSKTL